MYTKEIFILEANDNASISEESTIAKILKFSNIEFKDFIAILLKQAKVYNKK